VKALLGGLALAAGIAVALSTTGRPPVPAATAADSTGEGLHGVWVFLDPDSARSELPPPLGADVQARRPLLDTDRPVNPQLVARIAATGARVRVVSRWLRAVAIDGDSAALARVRALPAVTRLEPIRTAEPASAVTVPWPEAAIATTPGLAAGYAFGRRAPMPAAAASFAVGPRAAQDSTFYGPIFSALRELNIPVLHELGFSGAGVRIGILDTGFLLGHEALAGRTVLGQFDFIHNVPGVSDRPGDLFQQSRHGTAIMSLLAGYAPNRYVGGAWGAQYFLAKMKLGGDFDSRGDEDRWVEAAEWADAGNVRIINSSIGFRSRFIDREQIPYGDLDGNTTVTTRMADEAARRGILVIAAMGNNGPQAGTLWAPADADSIISVGAVDSLLPGRTALPTIISSRGPTADGRTKPELSARGGRIVAASVQTLTAYEGNLSGSSYAAPLIAASAALFMEAWPNLSIMAVRQALMLAGSAASAPNNVVGFGVPDVAAAIMFPDGIVLTQNSLTSKDLQGNLTTIIPTFRWETPQTHPRMRPITYRIEVARDSQFQNIIFADSVVEANIYTARLPLRPVERAWWRVVATSPLGVRRVSPPQPAFRVPSWVRLLEPNEPEPVFTEDPRPQLSWAPLAAPEPVGPFVYDVQIISVATGQIVQQIRGLTTSSTRVNEPLTPNQSYRWRVIARTQAGAADTVQSLGPFVITSTEAPPATILYQNFPNPFPNFVAGEGGTRVWFDLAQDGPVELAVYDLRGRLIRQLIPGRADCGTIVLRAGLYGRTGQTVNGIEEGCALTAWDGRDARGDRVARGVYVLRLRAGGVTDVKRMLFMPD
jgi:serine protease AprX